MLHFASLYLLAGLIVVTKGKKLLPLLLQDPFIVGLIALTGFSCFWSVTPDITFAYFRTSVVQYILAGYIVLTYRPRQVVGFMTKALGCTAVLSILYIIFLPSVGVQSRMGAAWRGVFPHQSYFAASSALLCISAFYTFLFSKQEDKRSGGVSFTAATLIGICLISIFYSDARTSLVGIVASFSILPFLNLRWIRGIKARTRVFLVLVYICLVGIPLLLLTKDFIIVEVLGKSPDLTGRTVLWEHLASKVAERPFGYGQGAFWHDPQLHQELVAVLDRQIPKNYNSHSGYLDCLIGIGYPGLLLLILAIAAVIRRNIILVFRHHQLIAHWCLQMIAFLSIAAYSDSFIGLANPRGIGGFIFMVVSLTSIRQLRGCMKRSAVVLKYALIPLGPP